MAMGGDVTLVAALHGQLNVPQRCAHGLLCFFVADTAGGRERRCFVSSQLNDAALTCAHGRRQNVGAPKGHESHPNPRAARHRDIFFFIFSCYCFFFPLLRREIVEMSIECRDALSQLGQPSATARRSVAGVQHRGHWRQLQATL